MIIHQVKENISEITLDDPRNHNAFSEKLIKSFKKVLEEINDNNKINCVVVKASGNNFSSGADLNWLQSITENSQVVNKEKALIFARFLQTLNNMRKLVIALVQGRTFGGALGVLAACDLVIAERSASFCFSEVKLGLIPATIAPYILQSMPYHIARRLFLTAESFTAEQGQQFGLVDVLCEAGQLEEGMNAWIKQIRNNGSEAMAAVKSLLGRLRPIDEDVVQLTVANLVEVCQSSEAQEGLQAFFEQRKERARNNSDS